MDLWEPRPLLQLVSCWCRRALGILISLCEHLFLFEGIVDFYSKMIE